jgi:pimeloyl-ACP methyl ester carboxylesterase
VFRYLSIDRKTERPGDRSQMIEPLQLQARGLVFDGLAAGPPAGELVVLLHGFPQTCACWIQVLEALAGAGYRAVAPDQRGYSPKARRTIVQAYRMPELVADVVAIADRLDAETFHLVGHDWGGVVAWRLAGRHPERVATLTAVSTPHPRAFARALVAGTQALRSAYIPVFRLPRLAELLLWAHRQWGLRLLLAQDGLRAEWVDTYTDIQQGAPSSTGGDRSGGVDELAQPYQHRGGVGWSLGCLRGAQAPQVGEGRQPPCCPAALAVQQYQRLAVPTFQHGGGHPGQLQPPLGDGDVGPAPAPGHGRRLPYRCRPRTIGCLRVAVLLPLSSTGTGSGGGSAAVGAGRRSSESTMGVNQWPRSQLVFTCSTGPGVDLQVQRSTMRAGARQVGSGQAMTSGMAASLSPSSFTGDAGRSRLANRPRHGGGHRRPHRGFEHQPLGALRVVCERPVPAAVQDLDAGAGECLALPAGQGDR